MRIRRVGIEFFHADGRKDRRDKANINCADAPKRGS
jgi:hypothetical protein